MSKIKWYAIEYTRFDRRRYVNAESIVLYIVPTFELAVAKLGDVSQKMLAIIYGDTVPDNVEGSGDERSYSLTDDITVHEASIREATVGEVLREIVNRRVL